jgi:hypothetical protein
MASAVCCVLIICLQLQVQLLLLVVEQEEPSARASQMTDAVLGVATLGWCNYGGRGPRLIKQAAWLRLLRVSFRCILSTGAFLQ